jgi:carbamoyltransferase
VALLKRAVGIHLGHDAGIAVVSENGIEKFLSKERLSRCKNAMGWDFESLNHTLATESDSPVGLTTTQESLGMIVGGEMKFRIASRSPSIEFGQINISNRKHRRKFAWASGKDSADYLLIRENWESKILTNGQLRYTKGLRQLSKFLEGSSLPFFDFTDNSSFGVLECQVMMHNRSSSGLAFMHHLAHATYAFWASGVENALIISHDGARSDNWAGGGYFWASKKAGVQPLLPGGFWVGSFYDITARWVGVLDPGKLMGLAPYGQPTFFNAAMVGTISDVMSRYGLGIDHLTEAWVRDSAKISSPIEWDTYGQNPPPIVADIAASAQKVLEENILANVNIGLHLTHLLGKQVDAVVMVGGVALNCPANSLVYQRCGKEVFVPPACNDEGLAIGAAVGAFFKAYKEFPPAPVDKYQGAYLGHQYSEVYLQAAVAGLKKVSSFAASYVARLLKEGAIVGLFDGRSEIGPRALGHRSILASPLIAENWLKVNKVKEREPWRPFAPICLEEDMHLHFSASDMKSRYMLFTHKVIHDKLPAITHVDGSARAQAANASCGIVYEILKAFKEVTGYGVLMNTSFNGKGVPIVETPQDAVTEARRIGLDFFVCDQGIYACQ